MDERPDSNYDKVTIAIGISGLLLLSILGVGIYFLMDDTVEIDTDWDDDGVLNTEDACSEGEVGWTSSLETDYDGDGCNDDLEDPDDDNDGMHDNLDNCPKGIMVWTVLTVDVDEDGCRDIDEDLDDDNDGVNDSEDLYPLDPLEWADSDSDSYPDNSDAFPNDPTEWSDYDSDGTGDNSDIFPFDGTEWADHDGDGTGDNADLDDDNDGTPDTIDVDDTRDSAVVFSLDSVILFQNMDLFDTDLYFCIYLNDESIDCTYRKSAFFITNYINIQADELMQINYDYTFDLDETQRYHTIRVEAFDDDALFDDEIDINPDPNEEAFEFIFDSYTMYDTFSINSDGRVDSNGDDGALNVSIQPFDMATQSVFDYYWTFDSNQYHLEKILNYTTYSYYRSLDHSIDWSNAESYDDVIPQYARFSTPDAPYVQELALELKNISIQSGYTTNVEIAEFIYSFVGAIPYQYDLDSAGNTTDKPKYPIEMMYENGGDCEDASALYISLVESLGYDAALMLGQVKASEDDEWGGHAWAVINMPAVTGEGYYGEGDKSSVFFYFVETTGYYDGSSGIGQNPWYEMANTSFYDVGE
ncbi:transglutaminase-like domain-containing protein [bacterium]|nr:transglutaminase-like domain-containing protein [bacterium]